MKKGFKVAAPLKSIDACTLTTLYIIYALQTRVAVGLPG
jgi:hypothetical protein